MAADHPSLLYWIALNRLPWPPARVRRIHLATGSERALASLGPGGLQRAAGAGRQARSAGDLEARAAGEDEAALWKQVSAGAIGAASPLAELENLSGETLLEGARAERERARALGIEVITLPDGRYPALLAITSSPPPVLYALGQTARLFQDESGRAETALELSWWWAGDETRGNISPFGAAPPRPVCIAVVGSRSASEYGLTMARRIGRALGRAGAAVVSGLALGVDAEAHAGALEVGGFTAAVLGGGLADAGDPAGGLAAPACPVVNRRLFARIAADGVVLSEYPLGTPPLAQHFPRRNRIIAGLCPAVTLVEAAARSGALTTARLALEEGRDVFAVPGRLTTPTATGCNGLIRSGSAQMLLAPEQILMDLSPWWQQALPGGAATPGREGRHEADPPPPDAAALGLDPIESRVFERLSRNDSLGIDAILADSRASSPETLAALLALELRGLIRSIPGGRYRLEEGVLEAGGGT